MNGIRSIRRVASTLSGFFLLGFVAGVPAVESAADGWITHPDVGESTPVVLQFRRVLDLAQVPRSFPVTVTADNRFTLYVNGERVASGPSTGSPVRWRFSTLDLARHLRPGRNVIAAVVWNFGAVAPLAQTSVATGFRLTGESISTAEPGWRVARDSGHTATSGAEQIPWQYYVASAPETIDASRTNWNWTGPEEAGTSWRDAVPAPRAAARKLVEDTLPAQLHASAPPGSVVRADLAGAQEFPVRPVIVPARSSARILLRRDAMVSAYPVLDVAGGRGSKVMVSYAEALYDAQRRKADRNDVADRKLEGLRDTFLPDGAERSFAPLWWRTFRFVEIDVTTAEEPLTLEGLRLFETGYPFEQVGRFDSDDAELNRIWEVGWRTLRIDAHETFMDSSFWEQLQYAGDTRLQMLISYAVGGDARLAEQAIDAFADSNVEGGIMEGAYPSRHRNTITTFALAWIGMLHDWHWQQPDPSPIRRHLPRTRIVLDWFGKLRTASGLLGANPHWNFIDWAGQRWDDRTIFPSYGKDGGSCLMSVSWLGALQQSAELEAAHGDRAIAFSHLDKAREMRRAIREHCWDAASGLYADNPDRNVFSQHMNALAVLYDVTTADEAPRVLERIVVPGRGIDAPDGMFTTTYYFAWYLVRAFEHAGLADRYLALLSTWKDLLKLNYTTWPESRGETRSDTHAWSAHPTADLLGIVAGIAPSAPGYSRVRIAPSLGDLKSLEATAATPHGPISVRYQLNSGQWVADIVTPGSLPGEFVWLGRSYPITGARTRLTLPRTPLAGVAD
jgi:alpha-L-rhamnosidase